MNLFFILNNGKNPKWKYYLKNIALGFLPKIIFRIRLKPILKEFEKRIDKQYILDRVNYYNKLTVITSLHENAKKLKENTIQKEGSVYYYDTQEIIRYFKPNLKWFYCYGDITHIPENPSILKSRPISNNNQNSILLKLDKVRHFIFLKDRKTYQDKVNKVIFRGKIIGKQQRVDFMQKFFGNDLFDIGDVSKHLINLQWKTPKKTLWEHLNYKFIMAIEGNDVASNLKWVMSSNSIAVMPKPTCETWFMEAKLIPNFHYIEVNPDFSDLEVKIQYYLKHPEKALEIIKNANEYCAQFFDYKREKIISLLVMVKYFEKTNQSY
ncbi:glycosyl transferase family 90 [Flavobacterium psychrophilum]|uniref:glycosyl transferase family 90 n=1 Tax=Flavobacterium psychrophilum TaxID=96345 RepID=UPI00106BCF75|nr:glycosyl transferase family 90 [Flavobacterium psychrophilum]EKT3956857.1 lipopolysaccharide biosynthesis protein [Flavobacterium psychrophilum]QRE60524.1 lipopolysaccharide biosynthesis protein [Flavobacterium psychrophilum]QRE62711.1 lipopolysaccharide biosynthesis protein [Flavobacterium psychrophilum]